MCVWHAPFDWELKMQIRIMAHIINTPNRILTCVTFRPHAHPFAINEQIFGGCDTWLPLIPFRLHRKFQILLRAYTSYLPNIALQTGQWLNYEMQLGRFDPIED